MPIAAPSIAALSVALRPIAYLPIAAPARRGEGTDAAPADRGRLVGAAFCRQPEPRYCPASRARRFCRPRARAAADPSARGRSGAHAHRPRARDAAVGDRSVSTRSGPASNRRRAHGVPADCRAAGCRRPLRQRRRTAGARYRRAAMKTPRALYLGLATAASATGAAPRSAAARAAAQSGANHARAARSGRAGRTRSGERVAFSASPLLVVPLPAWRSKFALFLLFCAFVALALRAFWLQGGVNTSFLLKQGEGRYARTLAVPATRGRVLDRHGAVLAGSVAARSVWAIPDDVEAPAAQLATLAQALQMPLAELKRKLATDDRSFVYLRRQIEPEVWERIERLELAGIHSSRESRRQYPEGATSAQVIGFTNVEDRGQDGVELALDNSLAGADGRRRGIKDQLRRPCPRNWVLEPPAGR